MDRRRKAIVCPTQKEENGEPTGERAAPLFPEGEKDFFLRIIDAQVTFVADAQGKATSLVLHQNGDRTAKRVE